MNSNHNTVRISCAYDGGNIQFRSTRPNELDSTITDVIVVVKQDEYTELEQIAHKQYFSFRSTVNDSITKCRYILDNASTTSYPEAWKDATVCYSSDLYDPDSWKRVLNTRYENGKLVWDMQHTGTMYFAYFPPFSYQRHLDLISKCQQKTTVLSLGQSLEGREIECVKVGTGERLAWIIHRQHPGETMAEFYAEGLLSRLLNLNDDDSTNDPVVKQVLEMYTFYIVPCMCPDGAVRGHLRTNAAGANLNREWATKHYYEAPTLERSPEVFWVLRHMDETGVDVFLDVHGDEEIPYNFLSGAEQTPAWGPRLQALHGAFGAAYERSNSDMQLEIGYPPPESPEQAAQYMNVATNQVSNRFNCLGMTLEMPFKDCWTNKNPERGWSPARSRQLGAGVLEAFVYVHPYLRDDTEFWTQLPLEDRYVEPTDDYRHLEETMPLYQFIQLNRRFYSDVHEIHKKETSGLDQGKKE
ncbi:hypothetical protein FisN_8Lh010 [Fistulifera solaris]|uniref:Peptidase M14 domain-containing protein n=1 Tax=Fistulifera solaris TaxID=1519565 RepID=A0A1Z5JD40_FISSO|nr:hypothetical protein FisN_8Lh010 [Fistulifera solaris]|eukprot:GAX11924.1 hypothetical protein FisN_8Lh010 [Fistulifera solaris]